MLVFTQFICWVIVVLIHYRFIMGHLFVLKNGKLKYVKVHNLPFALYNIYFQVFCLDLKLEYKDDDA